MSIVLLVFEEPSLPIGALILPFLRTAREAVKRCSCTTRTQLVAANYVTREQTTGRKSQLIL